MKIILILTKEKKNFLRCHFFYIEKYVSAMSGNTIYIFKLNQRFLFLIIFSLPTYQEQKKYILI